MSGPWSVALANGLLPSLTSHPTGTLNPRSHSCPCPLPPEQGKGFHISLSCSKFTGVTKLGQQVPLQITLPKPKGVCQQLSRHSFCVAIFTPGPLGSPQAQNPPSPAGSPPSTEAGLGHDQLSFRSPQFLNFKLLPNNKATSQ